MVTSKTCQLTFELYELDETGKQQTSLRLVLSKQQVKQIAIGTNAVINLISISFDTPLTQGVSYGYNFEFDGLTTNESGCDDLATLQPCLTYPTQSSPSFVIKPDIKQMLHGSCRKPHFDSGDGLVQVDNLLDACVRSNSLNERPSMLMMSGDQVYVDDVAGPMLVAIHQVIKLLGLYDETFDHELTKDSPADSLEPQVTDSQALYQHSDSYYNRKRLLPHTQATQGRLSQFFAASKKPIFTSDHGCNHLVSLAEVFAMYLLVWSPNLWCIVKPKLANLPNQLDEEQKQKYLAELTCIEQFIEGLPQVARALAHMPTYMIFDDHDITDDWNLTRGWEEAAYGNPFAKRIIGNALIGYYFCQGWGNAPTKFDELDDAVAQVFSTADSRIENGYLDKAKQDQLIDQLLDWHEWHFSLNTQPKTIVLDTRTQRWRSESNGNKPSGLMDWEALCEMQQQLFNQDKVILVSAAPIYGVKMIETIQRIVTFFGKPLMVDAENWMAHSGTANVMLNIFRHYKTPPNFIILSGDVHYSFFYEVTHRFKRNSSRIFQITASGIKNQFPSKLLANLERLNRYLYATYSPLNWFTKRRKMKVRVRKPDINSRKTLVNTSGIGLITLTEDSEVVHAELLTVEGKTVEFHPLKED